MTVRVVVQRKLYLDSIFLMQVADRIAHAPGILRAAAVMGTPANREALASAGYADPALATAGPDDVVIAIEGTSDESAAAAAARLDEWLRPQAPAEGAAAASIEDAMVSRPDASIALISVPGPHAAAAAREALEHGLHAFVFSSGVSIEDEVALKREAHRRGLLVMGPDCGTSIVGGAGLGFANAVHTGPIGIVGAAGTGIQEVATLLDRAGSGVSQAIGTGSRDLRDAVGGVTTFDALNALANDDATSTVVVISKPPELHAQATLMRYLEQYEKPVVVALIGATVPRISRQVRARTLDDAASLALALTHRGEVLPFSDVPAGIATGESERMSASQRFVRGLFVGGTLAYQAQLVLRDAGAQVRSNAPLVPSVALGDDEAATGHAVVDLGSESLTQGRPHPMIDPRLRRERILREAADPSVAVLLVDVVLGYGAAPDPAADLASAVAEARELARAEGRHLAVVASVTGTDADPQVRSRQVAALEAAGILVRSTAARAAAFAARIAALRSRQAVHA